MLSVKELTCQAANFTNIFRVLNLKWELKADKLQEIKQFYFFTWKFIIKKLKNDYICLQAILFLLNEKKKVKSILIWKSANNCILQDKHQLKSERLIAYLLKTIMLKNVFDVEWQF